MQIAYHTRWSMFRWLLAVAMTIAWAGLLDPKQAVATDLDEKTNPSTKDKDVAEPTAENFKTAAVAVEKQVDVYRALLKQIPRDSFDANAIAAKIGKNANELTEWVRANTFLTPYRGSLRGAAGVMMDRCGNSLDRSQLLIYLLNQSQIKSRLVHTRLRDEQASNLLKATWENSAIAIPQQSGEIKQDALNKLWTNLQLDPAATNANIERRNLTVQKNQESLAEVMASQMPRLAEIVGPLQGDRMERDKQVGVLMDHYWVQAEVDGKWIDLDTADVVNAKSTITPDRTIDAIDGSIAKQLPATEQHRIEVRIIAESLTKNKLKTALVTTFRADAADLGSKTILIALTPVSPVTVDPGEPDAGGKFKESLLKQTEWVPIIKVGAAQTVQGSFNDKGVVNAKPVLNPIAQLGGAASKIGGLLDDLDGPANAAPTPKLTGLFLELETIIPGQKGRIDRREIYDLFGPAKRATFVAGNPADAKLDAELDDFAKINRNLAFNSRVELIAESATFSQDCITVLAMEHFVRIGPKVAKVMQEMAGQIKLRAAMDDLGSLPEFSGTLLSLAAARRGLSEKPVMAIDQVNLIALHTMPFQTKDGNFHARKSTDIISNHTVIRPDATGSANARLRQGFLDTQLEALILPSGKHDSNTAELFAGSQRNKIAWKLIKSTDEAAFKNIRASDEAKARMAMDLKQGFLVCAPESAIQVASGDEQMGWWRIDPNDGTTVGMMDNGQGATMAEYAIMAWGIISGLGAMLGCGAFSASSSTGKKLGCVICGVLVTAITILAGLGTFAASVGSGAAATGAAAAAAGAPGYAAGGVGGLACNILSGVAS